MRWFNFVVERVLFSLLILVLCSKLEIKIEFFFESRFDKCFSLEVISVMEDVFNWVFFFYV